MKKVFFATLAVFAFLVYASPTKAQTASTPKIGLFDIDVMVQQLPEYRNVDSLVSVYEQDSLATEYQNYQREYQRLDSTYKADSAAKRPAAVLDYSKNLLQQIAFNLVYWQQISQNRSDQYRAQLAQPLVQRVVTAYKKVLAAKNYTLILKLNSFEVGSKLDNLFPLVAKEMNVTLPPGLMGDPNQALNETNSQGAAPRAGTGKP